MGWWPFGSEAQQADDKSATSLEGTYRPMRREERQRCWEARDQYFKCLDRNHILDSLEEADAAAKNCPKEGEKFEQDCAITWVKYFKAKRVADFKKEERIKELESQGAVPVSEANKPKWKIW